MLKKAQVCVACSWMMHLFLMSNKDPGKQGKYSTELQDQKACFVNSN